MNVTVIGTGPDRTCRSNVFSKTENNVWCMDIDELSMNCSTCLQITGEHPVIN